MGAALREAAPARVVAEHVMAGASWRQGAIQIPVYAQNDYLLELHLPGLPEAVAALLTQAAGGHELSEKGLVAMALAESADITVLLEPGIVEAITQLSTPRSRSMEHDLSAIRADGIADDVVRDLAARWGGRRERRSRPAGKLSLGKGADTPHVSRGSAKSAGPSAAS